MKRLLFFFMMIMSLMQINSTEHKYTIINENGFFCIKDSRGGIILDLSNKYSSISYVEFEDREGLQASYYSVDSLFEVNQNRKYGIINILGKEIIPVIYDVIAGKKYNNEYYFLVVDHNKKGVSNLDGRFIVPIRFNQIYFHNGTFNCNKYPYFEVRLNGKVGVYDIKGHEILPLDFTSISLNNTNVLQDEDKEDFFYFEVVFDDKKRALFDLNGVMLYPPTDYRVVCIQEDKNSSTNYHVFAGESILGKLGTDKYIITELYTNKILESSENDQKRRDDLEKAETFYSSKDYKKAAEYFSKALKTPNIFDEFIHFKLGVCYYHMKKYDKAIEEFNICKQNTPFQDIKQYADQFIEFAKESKSIKSLERQQTIMNLFQFALSTADAILMMQNNKKTMSNASITDTHYDSGDNNFESSNNNVTSPNNSKRNECGLCNGTGTTVEYTTNFGISGRKYCETCGKTVDNTHYHRTCIGCGGKGYR